jgi:creatinine amidohydrolase
MPERPEWGEFEKLRPAQIDRIKCQTPVAYLPWGALEWHSYQNPVGLDGLKAHALLVALARECGGVVLPTVFAGTDTIKPFKGFRHTLDHTEATVEALMREYLEQLADEGFRVIVLLTGHYGGRHVHVMRQTAAAFRERHPQVELWDFPEWEIMTDRFPANHAAHGETSLMLHFAESLVDQSELPTDRAATLDADGVWGEDPRTATAEAGMEMLRVFVDAASVRVREMLARSAG